MSESTPFTLLRQRVDARLEAFLADVLAHTARIAADAVPPVEQVRALTMRGGKRLRAGLVLAAVECTVAWESLGPAVVELSAAIELLQTYLLVHDDWMDGDRVRRGGPTVHVALAERYEDTHRGASVAVLAGDLASALAQQLVVNAPVSDARLRAVLGAYVTMQREVVLGQTLDVVHSTDLEAIHDLKTGSYTVRGPLALGHAAAGGNTETWRALLAFAQPAGVAFQLRDDLIGAFGDAGETGKSAGGDLREGKLTAPVRHALAHLRERERDELRSLLGCDGDGVLERARELLRSVDAQGAVEARIETLRAEALGAIESSALRSDGRTLLATLAHRLTERRS